jgi:hypothetical protein
MKDLRARLVFMIARCLRVPIKVTESYWLGVTSLCSAEATQLRVPSRDYRPNWTHS